MWKRTALEVATIVGSILLAFSIDAWWDEFRDREDEEIILRSLLEELVQVEENVSYLDQYVKAIGDSANVLLEAAVGDHRELGEREIDRRLADLTWFVSVSTFDVPELESLVRNDELFLIEGSELRQKLRSWSIKNQDFKATVEWQETFVNDRFLPYLEDNALYQQIYNVSGQTPGHPEDTSPIEKIEISEMRSHSQLLDDLVFQNLLSRRISRMHYLTNMQGSDYVVELRELIDLIEQELAE